MEFNNPTNSENKIVEEKPECFEDNQNCRAVESFKDPFIDW